MTIAGSRISKKAWQVGQELYHGGGWDQGIAAAPRAKEET